MDGVPRVPEQRRPGSSAGAGEREPAPLRFSVLGPVRAWRGEEPLNTGSPQQRALLAALLLREGRTATAAELIDALWGEEPPSQALAAVRTYASRLRRSWTPAVLVSESGGYAIRGLPRPRWTWPSPRSSPPRRRRPAAPATCATRARS